MFMGNFEKNIILMKRMLFLVEIAKHGKIQQTAKILGMKQSNLSKIIIDFEKDFNVKFFLKNFKIFVDKWDVAVYT